MRHLFFTILAVLAMSLSGCQDESEPDLTAARDQKELSDLTSRLFMYTDERNWQGHINENFTPTVLFDTESAGGGPPRTITSQEITSIWEEGLRGIDAIHHQAGHEIITVNGNQATIYAYSVATHYRAAATRGNTRTFVGSYDLRAERTARGWRLNQFKYNLRYMDGNLTLE
jgi:hypothetical protein